MLLELAEVKNYLRVDTDEEDGLVTRLSQSAEKLCMDVARIADAEEFAALGDTAKTAVLWMRRNSQPWGIRQRPRFCMRQPICTNTGRRLTITP